MFKKQHPEITDWQELLSKLADEVDTRGTRFVWTKSGGWVDFRHFFRAASWSSRWWISKGMTKEMGESSEIIQAVAPDAETRRSAFSVEDLPSNGFGADFGADYLDESQPVCSLEGQIGNFIFKTLGGDTPPPMDKIDDFNEIKNLGYTPVLALNDPSLRTSGTGIKYKSSGNLGIDITYLGWIEAGRKIYGP